LWERVRVRGRKDDFTLPYPSHQRRGLKT